MTSIFFLTRMLLIPALCFSTAVLFAQSFRNNLVIAAGAGYNNTDFRWSIAGNSEGTNPNIYSELIYNPVKSAGFFIDARYQFLKNLHLQISYQRSGTFKGDASDIDYAEDNRVSRINDPTEWAMKSEKGYRQHFIPSLQYSIVNSQTLMLKAGLGFLLTKELYYLTDPEIEGLNSSYLARWKGFQFTTHTSWNFAGPFAVNAGVAYTPLKYHATANWNIQEEFRHPVSFTHDAKGDGMDYKLGFSCRLSHHINITLDGSFSKWQTGYGRDILYLVNGETPETRMNGAFRKNKGLRTGIEYTF